MLWCPDLRGHVLLRLISFEAHGPGGASGARGHASASCLAPGGPGAGLRESLEAWPGVWAMDTNIVQYLYVDIGR